MNSSSESRILWKWKSNADPWANFEADMWEEYSDIENCMIENAHRQNRNHVELHNYWIDLDKQIQINKQDVNKQRPIRREIMEIQKKEIREDRFTVPQPKLDRQTLLSHDPFRSFISNSGHTLSSDSEINEDFIEKAARGIELEGTKLGKTEEAQDIVDKLRKVKNMGKQEILECCVQLYTADTFLYRLINKVMREAGMCKGMFTSEKDQEYGRTLGPYCALLDKYLRDSPNQKDIVVYRCAPLTDEMVDDYKKNIGNLVWWDAFSSTTKNKQAAFEFQGNTLFVIYIPGQQMIQQERRSGVDISSLSVYPGEEEILLHPAIQVSIEKVDYDPSIKKHVIQLQVYG